MSWKKDIHKDKCENCGLIDKRVLTIHHVIPQRDWNIKNKETAHNPRNIKILCANCHRIETLLSESPKGSKKMHFISGGNKIEKRLGHLVYPLFWYGNDDGFIGICGFSKKMFNFGFALEALIVRDIIIANKTCEEGKRCLVTKCPFNKTTPESFIESKPFTDENLLVWIKDSWNKLTNRKTVVKIPELKEKNYDTI